jgi:23S rRNA (guanosine2251-2'-O)-methyltransferase
MEPQKRKLANEELGRKSVEAFKQSKKTSIVVVLDNVRSLNNIGSVFRTADAFCIEAVYLCGITATPPNKDIHKTALGATESVHWEYFPETGQALTQLKNIGYSLMAVEQAENSTSLEQVHVEKNGKYALIFGHEVHGVAQDVVDACSVCIEIPQIGTKHSFNISVSVGIVLWEFYRKVIL